jgi:hypothetical protein
MGHAAFPAKRQAADQLPVARNIAPLVVEVDQGSNSFVASRQGLRGRK